MAPRQCIKCGKQAEEGEFCNPCFVEVVGKRIRKGFKIDMKKDKRLLVLDKLSEVVIKEILKGSRIELIKKHLKDFDIEGLDDSIYDNKKLNNYIDNTRIDKIILPWTADDEIDGFFIGLFSKNRDKKEDGRFIKLFKPVTNEELSRFARIKGVKTGNINKNNEFINKIAERYPEIKHSTLKSIQELNELR